MFSCLFGLVFEYGLAFDFDKIGRGEEYLRVSRTRLLDTAKQLLCHTMTGTERERNTMTVDRTRKVIVVK